MNLVVDRIPEEHIEQAKAADILALAGRYTELRRKTAAGEYEGPCSKCGGSDRFVVHQRDGWWFCRNCHEKRDDAIGLLRWLQPGLSFADSVAQLIGGVAPARSAPMVARTDKKPRQSEEWQLEALRVATEAHERLWSAEGEPTQTYLLGRGLEPHTWLQYELGYEPDAALPGTRGQRRAPAVVLPWRRQDRVFALRYRFVDVQHYEDTDGKPRKEKLTAETGSQFAGKLFGSLALPEFVTMPVPEGHRPAERQRTLIICEGELNAMSIWQVAGNTRLDTLSVGSESQAITPKIKEFAARYGQVIVWADKEQVAQRLMAAFPGAVGIKSPNGMDANDLLRAGLLGGFLATVRANHTDGPKECEGLLWALYDAAMRPNGIDTGAARVLQHLATQMGKRASLRDTGNDCWVAA